MMGLKKYCLYRLSRSFVRKWIARSKALTGLFIKWSFETWPDYLTDVGEFIRQTSPDVYEQLFREFFREEYACVGCLDGDGRIRIDWASWPLLQLLGCRGLDEVNNYDFRARLVTDAIRQAWYSCLCTTNNCQINDVSCFQCTFQLAGEDSMPVKINSWRANNDPRGLIYNWLRFSPPP